MLKSSLLWPIVDKESTHNRQLLQTLLNPLNCVIKRLVHWSSLFLGILGRSRLCPICRHRLGSRKGRHFLQTPQTMTQNWLHNINVLYMEESVPFCQVSHSRHRLAYINIAYPLTLPNNWSNKVSLLFKTEQQNVQIIMIVVNHKITLSMTKL